MRAIGRLEREVGEIGVGAAIDLQSRRNVVGPSSETGQAVSAVVVAYICCTQ